MTKPEWGTKRICPSCGARYYDFRKPMAEIVCPKCQTQFDPEAFLKSRRARVAAVAEKPEAPAVEEPAEADVEEAEPAEDDEAAKTEGEEAEDEEMIEDASELGEDEDDMAEVIENVDEEEER